VSVGDYSGAHAGRGAEPIASDRWHDLVGYATGATPHGKRALVPAAYLQFPYLPRDQYELGLDAGLLDATYPLDYADYRRMVEDVLRTHVRDSYTAAQATMSMLANEPGHSFTYCYDLDCDRACTVVIEEIAAVDPAHNDVIIIGRSSSS